MPVGDRALSLPEPWRRLLLALLLVSAPALGELGELLDHPLRIPAVAASRGDDRGSDPALSGIIG